MLTRSLSACTCAFCMQTHRILTENRIILMFRPKAVLMHVHLCVCGGGALSSLDFIEQRVSPVKMPQSAQHWPVAMTTAKGWRNPKQTARLLSEARGRGHVSAHVHVYSRAPTQHKFTTADMCESGRSPWSHLEQLRQIFFFLKPSNWDFEQIFPLKHYS